jgi:hypothetical protein
MTARDPNNIPYTVQETSPMESEQAGHPSANYPEHQRELSSEEAELRKKIDARTEYLNSIKLLLS